MRRLTLVSVAILIGVILASILATRNALVIWDRSAPEPGLGRGAETVRIAAPDGAVLEAWLFTPAQSSGGAVILLHGVGDNRQGMLEHSLFLRRAGYTVLLPDSRAHGASGGAIVTYGVLERHDVHAWADYLFAHRPVARLYGLGVSMGASILLQSLTVEARFRAVVADCPFSTFEAIAYALFFQATGAPRSVFWPVIQIGFIYARLRQGIDLAQASPIDAVGATGIPILLIHGMRDDNIEPRHSRALHDANPRGTRLWEVAGAGHVASFSTAPTQYPAEVLAFFRDH
jgi:dipeptidyl aminopeptidase/acylaminoacyl peptidase